MTEEIEIKTISFTVTGEALTNFARMFWREGNVRKSYRLLREALHTYNQDGEEVVLPEEVVLSICTGQMELIGLVTAGKNTLELVYDDTDETVCFDDKTIKRITRDVIEEPKEISEEEVSITANIEMLEKSFVDRKRSAGCYRIFDKINQTQDEFKINLQHYKQMEIEAANIVSNLQILYTLKNVPFEDRIEQLINQALDETDEEIYMTRNVARKDLANQYGIGRKEGELQSKIGSLEHKIAETKRQNVYLQSDNKLKTKETQEMEEHLKELLATAKEELAREEALKEKRNGAESFLDSVNVLMDEEEKIVAKTRKRTTLADAGISLEQAMLAQKMATMGMPRASVEMVLDPLKAVERYQKITAQEVKEAEIGDADSGWIALDGTFYPCEYMGHDDLAYKLNEANLSPTEDKEKLATVHGWVLLSEGRIDYYSRKPFTKAQKEWIYDYAKYKLDTIGKDFIEIHNQKIHFKDLYDFIDEYRA